MRCSGSPWHGDNFPEDMTVKLRALGGRHAPAKESSGEGEYPVERKACVKAKDERTCGEFGERILLKDTSLRNKGEICVTLRKASGGLKPRS